MRFPLLLPLLAALAMGRAQGPGRMAVHSLRAAAGIPDAQVNALIQDREGRYWAANELGLFVGDGHAFLKVPTQPSEDRPGFKGLVEDASGKLLALSIRGLWVLRAGQWQRTGLSLPPSILGQRAALLRDRSDRIWVVWNQKLLLLTSEDQAQEVPAPGPGEVYLSTPPLGPDLLARVGHAAWRLEGRTWVPLPPFPLLAGEALIRGLEGGGDGTLWIGTSQRLLRLPPGGRAWVSDPDPQGEQGHAGGVCSPAPGEVWAMGDLWAQRLDRPEFPLSTTPTFSIYAMRLLLRDREGHLWADQNGLHRVGGPWRLHSGQAGLPIQGAWQTLRDAAGRLWTSSPNGLFRNTSQGWVQVEKAPIHSQIALGPDGAVWAAMRTSGRILRFATHGDHLESLPPVAGLAGVEAIRGPSATRSEVVVPTRRRGLLWGRWEAGRWRWDSLPDLGNPLNTRTFSDPAGRLHLLTRDPQGDAHHAFPGGPWRRLPPELGPQFTDFLSWGPEAMLAVRYAPPELHSLQLKGSAWVSTGRLDLTWYSPATVAYGVRPLEADRLWVLTDHGVLDLDLKHPESARHFTTAEGLPFDDCNQFGLLVEADRIWVSTGTGLASFDRSQDRVPAPLPHPLLLGVRWNEEAASLDLPTTFSAGTRSLHLTFGIPAPGRAAHIRYYWRDLERGGPWRLFEGPTLTFLDPAPGRHLLQVRGLEPGGKASAVWQARFEIQSPWWRRPWALALWGILLGGLALTLHRLRLRRIEHRNRELADQVAQRTRALAESEARERAASQAKSTFLANMSHELRTPLNAILLYSELIHGEAEDAGNRELARDSARILSSGKHLLSLINGILDLSKIEAGKMTLDWADVDLRILCEEVVATLTPLADQRRNRLEVQVTPAPLTFRTDALKVKQVLLNLVGNAVKFTHEGRILLSAHAASGGVELTVHDTGVGLTPEQISRIFHAYEQGDRTTKASTGGTGLGLAISRRFVELLGGRIEVESQPGEGTTFRVHLPADPTL